MTKTIRILLLLIVQFAVTSSVFAQCGNQVCGLNGSCYACFSFSGFSCSPHIARCPQSCTETRCGASAEVQGVLSEPATPLFSLLQPSSQPSLKPMSDACIEQTAKAESPAMTRNSQEGIRTVAEWQKNSPVNLIELTTALNKDKNLVVKRVVIENLGTAPVVGYQLGWMLIFEDREPEIQLLDPVAVPERESKAVMEIGEPLPIYSVRDESIAASQEEAFISSARNAVPPITQVPGLRAINIFIASVKREGLPEFHENVSELSNQVKARFTPIKATTN